MLRFVVGPDGDVVPDLKRNLPGRGVWVTADAAHVAQAVKRLLFAKAFKDKVSVSATLTEEIDRLMEQQALQDQLDHKALFQPLCLGGWVYN
jgi:predicted RNA-binding protein YlxR (DUF448 family)